MQRVGAFEAEQRLWDVALCIEDRSLSSQQLHHECVLRCGLAREATQAQRRVKASQVDAVLQADRQTVQATERSARALQTGRGERKGNRETSKHTAQLVYAPLTSLRPCVR